MTITTSGCGGSKLDPVAQAAVNSSASAGYTATITVHMPVPGTATGFVMTGTGSFAPQQRSGSLTIDVHVPRAPRIPRELAGRVLRIREIIVWPVIYLNLPTDPLRRHRQWVKFDVVKAAAAAGMPGLDALSTSTGSADPTQALQLLRATSDSVVVKGAETVNGVQTIHYHARSDLDDVANRVPPASRDLVRRTIQTLKRQTGVHELQMDVWIDRQHLIRRMRWPQTFATNSVKTTAVMTIDIRRYGPQPRPALPPLDEVIDATKFAGRTG